MSGAAAIDRLDLRLHVEGGRLARFDLTSTRRPEAAKVLEGRPVDEALALVPLMFALCATAQGAAAGAAIEAALGHRRSPRILALRRLRVDVEILADHARHLLVDAPRLVGGSADIPGARRILGLARALANALADPSPAPGPAPGDLARDLKEAIGTHGFAMPVERFAAIGTARHLIDWAMAAPTSPAHLLREAHVLEGFRARKAVAVPPLLAPTAPDEIKALIGMIDGAAGEAFLARPTWGRCPRATGPAVRLAGQPLVARCGADWGAGITYRLVAVLCELALLACALPARIAALEAMAEGREDGPARSSGDGVSARSSGEGVGMVEAARGLLIHRVVVREGRVARWRILAPTEWNLHPQGALASLLIGCPVSGTEEACLLAHWLVLALDPCVPCVITAIGEGADA